MSGCQTTSFLPPILCWPRILSSCLLWCLLKGSQQHNMQVAFGFSTPTHPFVVSPIGGREGGDPGPHISLWQGFAPTNTEVLVGQAQVELWDWPNLSSQYTEKVNGAGRKHPTGNTCQCITFLPEEVQLVWISFQSARTNLTIWLAALFWGTFG